MKRRFLLIASASLAFFAGCGEGETSDYTGYVDTGEDMVDVDRGVEDEAVEDEKADE
jgi:hypothetical protein